MEHRLDAQQVGEAQDRRQPLGGDRHDHVHHVRAARAVVRLEQIDTAPDHRAGVEDDRPADFALEFGGAHRHVEQRGIGHVAEDVRERQRGWQAQPVRERAERSTEFQPGDVAARDVVGEGQGTGPGLERPAAARSQRLEEGGLRFEAGGDARAGVDEVDRSDPRPGRRHCRDIEFLKWQECPLDRDVDDVLRAPGRGLDGHGGVACERPQDTQAVHQLGSPPKSAFEHVVVAQQEVVAREKRVPRVGAGRQRARLVQRQELDDLERHETDELDVIDGAADREVPQHLPVLHGQRVVMVMVRDDLGHDLAVFRRRREAHARACRPPAGCRLTRQARMEVLGCVRHVIATGALPARRGSRGGRVRVAPADAEAGDDAAEDAADTEAPAEAARLGPDLHLATARCRFVERAVEDRVRRAVGDLVVALELLGGHRFLLADTQRLALIGHGDPLLLAGGEWQGIHEVAEGQAGRDPDLMQLHDVAQAQACRLGHELRVALDRIQELRDVDRHLDGHPLHEFPGTEFGHRLDDLVAAQVLRQTGRARGDEERLVPARDPRSQSPTAELRRDEADQHRVAELVDDPGIGSERPRTVPLAEAQDRCRIGELRWIGEDVVLARRDDDVTELADDAPGERLHRVVEGQHTERAVARDEVCTAEPDLHDTVAPRDEQADPSVRDGPRREGQSEGAASIGQDLGIGPGTGDTACTAGACRFQGTDRYHVGVAAVRVDEAPVDGRRQDLGDLREERLEIGLDDVQRRVDLGDGGEPLLDHRCELCLADLDLESHVLQVETEHGLADRSLERLVGADLAVRIRLPQVGARSRHAGGRPIDRDAHGVRFSPRQWRHLLPVGSSPLALTCRPGSLWPPLGQRLAIHTRTRVTGPSPVRHRCRGAAVSNERAT